MPIVAAPTARMRLQPPRDLGAAFCSLGSEVEVAFSVGTTATHEVDVIVRVPPLGRVVVITWATGMLVATRPVVIVFSNLLEEVGATSEVVGAIHKLADALPRGIDNTRKKNKQEEKQEDERRR